MDAYEATKTVFSRIQNLDPENAPKIMGLLLIQDHGEKEMIRFAFGPENLLHSLVVKARQELGISVSTVTPPPSTTPCSTNSNPFSVSRQNSRFLPDGVQILSSLTIPSTFNSPSSVSPPSSSWGVSGFSDFGNSDELLISPSNNLSSPFPSFFPASAAAGISSSSNLGPSSNSNNTAAFAAAAATTTAMKPSTPPFYPSGAASRRDLIDEIQLQDQLELSSTSPGASSDSLLFPYDDGSTVNGLPAHRRSFSVSDINLGPASGFDDPTSGFGWKPCLYYARGYCKNGSSCRFVHSGGGLGEADAATATTPVEECPELLLRSKSMQQQKLMAAMASSANNPFSYSGNKCLDFLLQQQQQNERAATLMMGEDMHKFGRSRLDRSEFLINGRPDLNPGSRQIYLTFPADSTFREEDVSNYFSIYGPVQDVRIPYQQKRMFGFVTFVYPDTVKMILSKGNPHFVCDARVLVKPYKEKGKVPDKYRKQQQQVDQRGEFSACNSPTALDSRDPFDLHLAGARMIYNTTQEMLWRRKLEEEQADFQQALELQNRRIMDLQLIDVKRNHHHRTLSTGGAIPSPLRSPNSFFNHSFLGSDRSSPEAPEGNSNIAAANDQKLQQQQQRVDEIEKEKYGSIKEEDNNGNGKEYSPREDNRLPDSLEHYLPDSPFASPTRRGGASKCTMPFSSVAGEPDNGAAVTHGNLMASSSLLPATSSLDMAPFKSCYFQMPSFIPGHGAIGM